MINGRNIEIFGIFYNCLLKKRKITLIVVVVGCVVGYNIDRLVVLVGRRGAVAMA